VTESTKTESPGAFGGVEDSPGRDCDYVENVLWGYTSPTLCSTHSFAGDHGEHVLRRSAGQKQQWAGEDGEWHRG